MSVALANLRSWLSWHYWSEGAGAALIEGLAVTADGVSDLLRQALRCGFPSVAPVDALPEIAFDQYVIPPQILSVPALRTYLADPWTRWANAGTRARMLAELALLGYPNCQIVSYTDLYNAGHTAAFTTGGVAYTSFWYLIIKQSGFTGADNWGDMPDPPGSWDAAPYVWDGDITTAQLDAIRQVIHHWKNNTSCRYIEIWYNADGSDFGRFPVWEDHEIDQTASPPAAQEFFNQGWDTP